jgi:hypothetical protein
LFDEFLKRKDRHMGFKLLSPWAQLRVWWFGLSYRVKRWSAVPIIAGLLVFGGLQWMNYRSAEDRTRHFLEGRKFCVLVPLDGSRQEYLAFVAGQDYEKASISKKVSQDIVRSIEASTKEWFRTYRTTLDPSFVPEKVKFFYYPEGFDDNSYASAFKEAKRRALQEGFEIAGVIGHVTSTSTDNCGKLYADERLPMILPLATASSLTYNLKVMNVPAVLRLPPANDKQSKVVSDFLLQQGALRVTIVKDLTNQTYGEDLIDSFRDDFVRDPFKKLMDPNSVPGPVNAGMILAVVPAGGKSGEPFLHTSISNLKGDALVLFAMTEGTLETLAQARASGFSAKYTILTDGAVDEYLLPRINLITSDQKLAQLSQSRARQTRPLAPSGKVQPVDSTISSSQFTVPYQGELFMTFPLKQPMPDELTGLFRTISEPKNLEMTHAQYVVDAVQIMLTVLHEKVFKPRINRPAKELIAEVFNKWQKDGQINEVSFTYDKQRVYDLDPFGSSTNMEFHLFHAKLLPVEGDKSTAQVKSVQWEHDKDRCPVEHKFASP